MNKLNLIILSAILVFSSNLILAEGKKKIRLESEGKRIARVLVGFASFYGSYELANNALYSLNSHRTPVQKLVKVAAGGISSVVLGFYGLKQIRKAIN